MPANRLMRTGCAARFTRSFFKVLDKSVLILNCYYNYMVNYAKQLGLRMLLVAARCHVMLRADVLRQT
jgi:hypothetical protein